MLSKNTIYVVSIIIVGFLTRLININQPILEVAGWRQCYTASIARNIYYNGMNIFYPQALRYGDTKGYIGGTKFNIYPYPVAILYKLFGVHECLGRLVSIAVFCGGAFFLYKLTNAALKLRKTFPSWPTGKMAEISKRSTWISLPFYRRITNNLIFKA